MAGTSPYGPGTPQVVEPGDMSVDWFLKSPTQIVRTIQNIPNRYFIGETIYRDSQATGGAVLFDRLTQLDLFVDVDPNKQPGNVEPGSDFPAIDVSDAVPNVVLVQKNGAYFTVTDEEVRRDNRDKVGRNLLRLTNTLVRISDAKAVATLFSDPTVISAMQANAGAYWDVGTSQMSDLDMAISAIDNNEMGYACDTAIIHPDAFLALQSSAKVQAWLPREKREDNPLFKKQLSGFKELDWIVTKRAPRTKVAILQRKMPGFRAQEIPPFTDVIDQRERQRTRIQSGRVEAFGITDPYSVFVINNVIAAV